MNEHEGHSEGLAYDLSKLLSRRRALGLLGGAGALALTGCATSNDSDSQLASNVQAPPGLGGDAPEADGGSTSATAVDDGTIPEETAGPYPADGSNGKDVLNQSGIVRRDIRSSFGSASGVAEGVPLTIALKVIDVTKNSQPLKNAAVYLWHCDRSGQYSMYSSAIVNENYLRGIQVTDRKGRVRFTSIFPACYPGRWPHLHFEIYPSLDDATTASNRIRTTQLAFPRAACNKVYATTGYETSVSNLQQVSLSTDTVFKDGHSLQMATMTGSIDNGLRASLKVPV